MPSSVLLPLPLPFSLLRKFGFARSGGSILRSLQPLGLYPANSIFIGDYLTTPGQAAQ